MGKSLDVGHCLFCGPVTVTTTPRFHSVWPEPAIPAPSGFLSAKYHIRSDLATKSDSASSRSEVPAVHVKV